MLHRNFTLIPTRASYVMKKGYGGGRKKSHTRKKNIMKLFLLYFGSRNISKDFFPNRILRNKLYSFMYIIHDEYSVITAN